jgi:hypothetical protein
MKVPSQLLRYFVKYVFTAPLVEMLFGDGAVSLCEGVPAKVKASGAALAFARQQH